jgi:hypothetical protein
MPGQPTYQKTAGTIKKKPVQPIQQVTMPGQPTYQKTAGTLGGYEEGRDWDKNLADIGKAVNKSQVGGYQAPTAAPANSSLGQQNQTLKNAAAAATIATPANAGYQAGQLQEGYDETYLNKLAQSKIDPLNEAYQESLRLAGADFNRLGIRGSGFEVGEKFGGQPGSITSKYLTEVGNVARDVALAGAEAERADRFRQAESNEAARQNWSAFDRDLAGQNFNNQATMLDATGRIVAQDQSNQQFWAKDELDRELATKDYQLKAVDTGMQADQADQANKQWWTNFSQSQLTADDQAMMDRWKGLSDLEKWDAERGDQARQFDAGKELDWANFEQSQMTTDDQAMMDRWKGLTDLQKWDSERGENSRQFDVTKQLEADTTNANIQDSNIKNMISLMTAQGKTAEQIQDAYYKALEAGNTQAAGSAASQASIGAKIQDLLFK